MILNKKILLSGKVSETFISIELPHPNPSPKERG
jgi:hypothetical protein